MSLRLKFCVTTIGCLAVVMAAGAWYLNRQQTKASEREARNRSEMVLGFSQACRKYVKKELRPAVQHHTDEMIFEAMSSTFATTGILKYFNENMPEYSYRQPTFGPLNLANRADEYEAKLLAAFAADPDLEELSGYRTVDGKEQFYTARPIVMEAECSKCHGDPDVAPSAVVERYGREHGYNWREGEVVSAVMVSVPTEDLRAQLASMMKTVLGTLIGLTVVLIVLISGLFERLVNRRVRTASEVMGRVASGPSSESRILDASGDELGVMAHSFNHMADSLRDSYAMLEQRVEERTRELAESETRMRAIVENAADGVITIDEQGIVEAFNNAAEHIFGYATEEVIGSNVDMLMHSPYREEHDEYVHRYLHTGEKKVVGIRREVTGQRKDGSTFPMELHVSEVRLGDRRLFTGIVRDMTERKRAEEQIIRQNAALEAISAIFQETLACDTEEDVAQVGLKKAEELTGSKFGFLGEVNQNGRFDTIALSNPGWDACALPTSKATAMIKDMEIRGIWGTVIRTQCSQIINDPASHPERVGTPEGHPKMTSFLGVPLRHGGKVIGVIALANKESGYEQSDMEQVETLSIAVMEALNRKRAQVERETLYKQLAESSREAGMAEIATGVLHNVGNVLNSINVSAALVANKARRSKVSGVAKAAELLSEHGEDLGTFITEDEKGKQLPAYLTKLAEHLADEQTAIVHELRNLTDNVEHVNHIISMQQSYTGVSDVVETVSIVDVLENVLQTHTASLDRHGIRMAREYGDIPPMALDKHKLLQILANLVRNAKNALVEGRGQDRRLTLRIRASADDRVRVEVIDNGVGIAEENLTRVFAHGFTTTKDGHGFGLHSSALAAKEMGGSLTALSDGPGKGATFTLELPLQPVEVAR